MRSLRVLAEALGGFPAVQARHHDVQRDDVWLNVFHFVESVLPVDGGEHLEAFELEVDRDQLSDDIVVVYDEHSPRTSHEARLPSSLLRRCHHDV